MGNYLYIDNLIGLTIDQANDYIINNCVYISRYNWNRITKVKRTYHSSFRFVNSNSTEINVYINDNNKITKLVFLG